MKAARKITESKAESLLADAADEFTAELACGNLPDIEGFAKRYPQIAGAIQSLFPAIAALSARRMDDLSRSIDALGDFEIIDELGRGGMGIVYRARQTSLDRIVALKVLPISTLLENHQLTRFKNEAKAAATLDHSNIVPVYSVGVEQGVHFYAMRLIDGSSIADLIHDRNRITGADETQEESAPPSDLSPARNSLVENGNFGQERAANFFRKVAELGVQAANAREHAHTHGVLHRDIKPANLLLDQQGHLWVTDFGVARLENDASITVTGDLLGTVRYMSPEQATGQRIVDLRTDVYSLGVTLYEMLTSTPAFSGSDRLDLLQKIANETPVRPRRICPAIPSDLETIVLKAIEKDAGDRYESAAELGNDLQCFLDDRPITACPPSLTDVVTKWSRRHQPAVWATIATMILAVLLLAASTLLVLRANRSNKRQRQVAEANLQAALKIIDNGYAKEVELLKHEPGMTSKQQEYLTTIVEFYEQLPAEEFNDEPLLHRTCQAKLSLGEILRILGRDDDALKSYRSAIEIAQRLRNNAPTNPHFKRALAIGYDGLGQTIRQKQQLDESARVHETAMQFANELIADHPNDIEMQRLVTLRLNHALSLRDTTKKEEKIRKAIASVEKRQERFKDEIEFDNCLAQARDHLGSLLSSTGRRQEAEENFRAALQIQQKLAASQSSIPGFRYQAARIQNHLAVMLSEQGRSRQAEETSLEAIRTLGELTADYPRRVAYQIELARFQMDLGKIQYEFEHFDKAQRAHSKAIGILETLAADEASACEIRRDLATNYNHLGRIAGTCSQPKPRHTFSMPSTYGKNS